MEIGLLVRPHPPSASLLFLFRRGGRAPWPASRPSSVMHLQLNLASSSSSSGPTSSGASFFCPSFIARPHLLEITLPSKQGHIRLGQGPHARFSI